MLEWCCCFINCNVLYRTSRLNEKYDRMLYMFQKFAGEGLRTLCLAVRDLNEMFSVTGNIGTRKLRCLWVTAMKSLMLSMRKLNEI